MCCMRHVRKRSVGRDLVPLHFKQLIETSPPNEGGGSFTHVIKASEPVVSVILNLLINGIGKFTHLGFLVSPIRPCPNVKLLYRDTKPKF